MSSKLLDIRSRIWMNGSDVRLYTGRGYVCIDKYGDFDLNYLPDCPAKQRVISIIKDTKGWKIGK